MEILLTQAFTEQDRDIGWLQLLQGKASKYWIEDYKSSLPKTQDTNRRALLWGKQLILALWSFSKAVWKNRNEEIHGHSLHEARTKPKQKLEKQIKYFYDAYNGNRYLNLSQHNHLFDKDLDHHVPSSHEQQAAWLRSVKEALLVRKQHDEQAAASQKKWFKNFFLKSKCPQPLSSKTSTVIRRCPNRMCPKPGRPTNTRTLTPTTKYRKKRPQPSPTKPRLARVKGRRRLFKYSSNADMKKSYTSVTLSYQHSGVNRKTSAEPRQERTSYHTTRVHINSINNILMHPSSLKLGSKLQRKLKKLTNRKKNPGCKTGSYRRRKLGSGKEYIGKVSSPKQCSLEDYGFKVLLPKRATLVQISTVNAEATKNDFSGIYVSTVP
jgi:hypothetical protein